LSSGIAQRGFQKRSVIIAISTALFMVLYTLSGIADAVQSGTTITYGGLGAGEVVFSGTVHARKGITCAMCHEERGFASPLFSMKRGDNGVSMGRMEKGKSCGACHEVSLSDTRSCEKCHHK